jgi:hypothetical protein
MSQNHYLWGYWLRFSCLLPWIGALTPLEDPGVPTTSEIYAMGAAEWNYGHFEGRIDSTSFRHQLIVGFHGVFC